MIKIQKNKMTNSEKLLKVLGGDPNAYATNYGVRKAILSALGGNPESCSNINEVDLEILRIYQSGGGGTGGTVVLETANITKNGTYVPSEGYNGFDKAIVNVLPVLETANITKNGTYTPSSNYDGFGSVVVNVPADGGGTVKVLNGMKFGYSDTLPESLDTSGVTTFRRMFSDCISSNIKSIPQIDTSNGTNFQYMFYNCSSLTSVPQLNTSKGTTFDCMFYGCSKLTSIPAFDTSNCTDLREMFCGCSKLTSIPQLDYQKNRMWTQMFYNCSSLTEILSLDTSAAVNINNMFYGCTNLVTVSKLNFTNINYATTPFKNCKKLENVTFEGEVNMGFTMEDCVLISYDSVKSLLTAISNTDTASSKTLTLKVTHTDVDGELAALIATCNSKGWTISGLTLN